MSRSRFKYEKTFPIFRMSDVSNFRLLISIWDLISLYAVCCVPRAMWGPIIVTLQLYCVSANAFIGKDDCIHDRSLVVILQIDNFRMVHRVLIRHLFLIELSFCWFLYVAGFQCLCLGFNISYLDTVNLGGTLITVLSFVDKD